MLGVSGRLVSLVSLVIHLHILAAALNEAFETLIKQQ